MITSYEHEQKCIRRACILKNVAWVMLGAFFILLSPHLLDEWWLFFPVAWGGSILAICGLYQLSISSIERWGSDLDFRPGYHILTLVIGGVLMFMMVASGVSLATIVRAIFWWLTV